METLPRFGVQASVLALQPTAHEVRGARFRFAPHDVAVVATIVDDHDGTEDGLDGVSATDSTPGIESPIRRAPIWGPEEHGALCSHQEGFILQRRDRDAKRENP